MQLLTRTWIASVVTAATTAFIAYELAPVAWLAVICAVIPFGYFQVIGRRSRKTALRSRLRFITAGALLGLVGYLVAVSATALLVFPLLSSPETGRVEDPVMGAFPIGNWVLFVVIASALWTFGLLPALFVSMGICSRSTGGSPPA